MKLNSNFKFPKNFIHLIATSIIIFIVLFSYSSVYGAIQCDGGGCGNYSPTFNSNSYAKDNNKKHIFLTWKSEDGAFYDNNARLFYKIKGAKVFPCHTYQEWLNTKQLGVDSFTTGICFIPGSSLFKGAIKTISTFSDISGLSDKFIGDTESKISMFNDVVKHSLEIDPGRGFFFFDENEIEKIKDIHITFCKCANEVSLVGCISDLITPENIFDDDIDDVEDLENTLLNQTESVSRKTFDKTLEKEIVKDIKQKIGHTIARQAWKKSTKTGIGTFFGKILVPGFDVAHDKINKKLDSTKNIVKVISFDPKYINNEKILGFVINFPNQNKVDVFGITPNKQTILIDSTSLDESTHLLVDLIVSKDGLDPSIIPNLYAGKLN
ncbi:hypothetical protein [Candidatus Phytoplasma fraxini]|uniref:Uncharacterized protein n=1 Tax=Ash yellows phytoplasma TaxID=35780 RepID=A0ABZ2U858_ASHYP